MSVQCKVNVTNVERAVANPCNKSRKLRFLPGGVLCATAPLSVPERARDHPLLNSERERYRQGGLKSVN